MAHRTRVDMCWTQLLQNCFCILLLTQIGHNRAAPQITLHVEEEQQEGVKLGTISRQPSTLLPPGQQPSYQLLTAEERVRVDQSTGDLYATSRAIDRESQCPAEHQTGQCQLLLDAFINPGAEIIKIQMVIQDINDNAPHFQESIIQLSIPEDVAVGTRFELDHHAVDLDAGSNGTVIYQLEGDDGFFSVVSEGSAPVVVVKNLLDREIQNIHQMTLIAVDGGTPRLTGSTTLVVQVQDSNDNCPEFTSPGPITVSIPDNMPIGSEVAHVLATDPDLGSNAKITYSFSHKVSEAARAMFNLDSNTGVITLSRIINRSTTSEHVLKIWASGPHCPPDDTDVIVSVVPVASQQPVMEVRYIAKHQDQMVVLKENEPVNTALALLEVKTPDRIKGLPYIEGETPFVIKPQQGKYLLVTSRPLDFEQERQHDIVIVASDAKDSSIYHKKQIQVSVEDINDNAPWFHQSRFEVAIEENNKPGTILIQLTATDADSQQNGEVTYSLGTNTPPMFSINKVTGELSVSSVLDREHKEFYSLTVHARDQGSPPLQTSVTVMIQVLDQNDNRPAFITSEFIFFIPENFPTFGEVGVINVTDRDSGANGRVEVSLLNDSSPFVMDNVHGTLRCAAEVDREKQDRHEVWIVAQDHGSPSLSATAKVTVFVLDINDNPPRVLLPATNLSCLTVPPGTPPGSAIAEIYAVDADAGINSVISYFIIACEPPGPSPFQIDHSLGNITLARRLQEADYGFHHLFVAVRDGGRPTSQQATVWVNLQVNDTGGPCSLKGVPENIQLIQPSAQIQTMCISNASDTEKCQVVFLLGLSMIVASLLLLALVGTIVKCRQRNRKGQSRTGKDVQIPLKLKEAYDTRDWPDVQ
uniref:Protocadherin-20 n=1 Tax=Lepisosteus oculatus TaxID=7918 RepID=W5NC85_LEPOC|nr:PREDICTED: protocadherin-20-like [Lepisosteus oculatus]